jgi:hypothetical protein
VVCEGSGVPAHTRAVGVLRSRPQAPPVPCCLTVTCIDNTVLPGMKIMIMISKSDFHFVWLAQPGPLITALSDSDLVLESETVIYKNG